MISLKITLERTAAGVLGYVALKEIAAGEAVRTEEIVKDSIYADYDASDRRLGLEFLHAESADGVLLRDLARQLGIPELGGLDLAEMCKAPA